MEADTIANKLLHGWCLNTNYSCVALEWLHWQQHQLLDEDNSIRHAGNSDKCRIPHSWYTVDGYHQKTNTVYEFQGCFWHGCPVWLSIAPNPTTASMIGALTTCTVARRSNSTYCVIKVSG